MQYPLLRSSYSSGCKVKWDTGHTFRNPLQKDLAQNPPQLVPWSVNFGSRSLD